MQGAEAEFALPKMTQVCIQIGEIEQILPI